MFGDNIPELALSAATEISFYQHGKPKSSFDNLLKLTEKLRKTTKLEGITEPKQITEKIWINSSVLCELCEPVLRQTKRAKLDKYGSIARDDLKTIPDVLKRFLPICIELEEAHTALEWNAVMREGELDSIKTLCLDIHRATVVYLHQHYRPHFAFA